MMLLRDTYPRRDYKGLIKRLMDYSGERKGEVAELTAEAAEAIEELDDEVFDWKAYGKWNRTEDGFECDQCLLRVDEVTRFCPDCGARMEEE